MPGLVALRRPTVYTVLDTQVLTEFGNLGQFLCHQQAAAIAANFSMSGYSEILS